MAITKSAFTAEKFVGGNKQKPDAISFDESALSRENENASQGHHGSGRLTRCWHRLSHLGGCQYLIVMLPFRPFCCMRMVSNLFARKS
jgi:hypothetical protein